MSSTQSDSASADDAKHPTAHEDLPFATIVETINDGILVVRLGGEIIYANESMAKMLGYSRPEMVGNMLFDFMEEEWAERARQNLKRRQEGVEEMFDHRWQHNDGGGVWTLVSAKPMHDEDGVQWGSLVAIQNISERKEMEEEIRQARDELEMRVQERTRQLVETNERLQREVEERREAEERALEASRAKSAFLANMSHELRTPLNAVIGYTELIQEDLDFGASNPAELPLESIQSDLKKVHHSANHLLALINDILDLSKVEAGKMDLHLDAFDLAELVDEVIDTVRPLVAKNDNDLERSYRRRGEVVTDRTKLKQVLLNLVGNAAKFTEKGVIELSTAEAVVNSMPGVRIEVRDTGMGIDPESIDRLFEPFTQADESTTRKHGGTGLGLTICKRFCEMMGGTIDVQSTLGEGTTFTILLPTEHRSGLAEPSATMEIPHLSADFLSNSGEGPTVLVIDDDPHVHELMRRFLGPRGFHVISAFNGDQGVELARTKRPDVITLDVMMPGRDGWSVLSNLKAEADLESIPVVMVTMIDDKSIGYALGASDYLVKPIQRDRLVKVLARFHPERGGTALVVEDEDDVREVMARHLRRADWRVRTAENGTAALEMLDSEIPDVVVLDLMMPEMDGFEVAEIMRQEPRWQEIPIVVVTAMDLDDAQHSRLQKSVERILSKNVSSVDQVLKEVLAVTGAQAEQADAPEERPSDGEPIAATTKTVPRSQPQQEE
ncbi:response regulator [Persicimonas caeni]|uniref:histidine kinase n=1 Tax=Persicimonas caeni TaxID=2292766 RepID=A0A4Y6PMU0_PERCE|nr:response regulator [Persicimonas caeni]QDG49612.1 response regulator [Persicimonas caeni]QED30833.1 response regulator [Persicimonas caeni]